MSTSKPPSNSNSKPNSPSLSPQPQPQPRRQPKPQHSHRSSSSKSSSSTIRREEAGLLYDELLSEQFLTHPTPSQKTRPHSYPSNLSTNLYNPNQLSSLARLTP